MEELKRKFGGVTVYARSPAKAVTSSDDIVIFEVMTDDLERAWWSSCRARLEAKFAQDEALRRAFKLRAKFRGGGKQLAATCSGDLRMRWPESTSGSGL
jgi:hypothetical protein